MGLQLRHLLFAVVLGVGVGCAGLVRSRVPIIIIPLALAGLYVAAVTTARDGHTTTGLARGGVIGCLVLISATAILIFVGLASRYLPGFGISSPSRATFDTVWALGGLIMGFWLLLGGLGRILGKR